MAKIIDYSPGHAEYLAERLHPANIAELWSLNHHSPLEGIRYAVENSKKVWVGLDDKGLPAAIFGVGVMGIFENVGFPWLMCREDIANYRIALLKTFKITVGRMQELFDSLEGEIDARNTEVLKMCEWVGFKVEKARPYGIDNMPFHHIVLRRDK